ncbi:hypothetical protein [Reichenbachiella sp.]|uniref:hypothetical protein n=1 Tax=Reichenbachiella sp. TaxID=2184521 RepID=UPI003B58D0E8
MNKHKIWEYLIQITIVIFGVFLGMMLNEWNSDRKASNEQKFALEQILIEIEEHGNWLENTIPYHDTITHVVDSIVKNSDQNTLMRPFLINGGWRQIPKWKGTQIYPLHASAYESAKISNVLTNMDSELLGQISAYYEDIDLYNQFCHHITATIFNTTSNTKFIDSMVIIRLLKEDLMSHENTIQKTGSQLKIKIQEKL